MPSFLESKHTEDVLMSFTSVNVHLSTDLKMVSKSDNCRYLLTQESDGTAVLVTCRGELTSHLHPTLKWPLGLYGIIVNGLRLHELLTVLMFPLYLPPYPCSTLSRSVWASFPTLPFHTDSPA